MRRIEIRDRGRHWVSPAIFWALVGLCAVGATVWVYAEDTRHGDVWDWLDWLEAVLATTAASFLIVGVLWVSTIAATKRLELRRVRRALKRSAETR